MPPRERNLMASSSRRGAKNKKPLPILRFSVIFLTFLSLFSIALYSKRARRRSEIGTVAYSLWFEPDENDDLSSRVSTFIGENAKDDVVFKPHVTLLGPIYEPDESAIVSKTEKMVREIREKRTRFGEIRFPKGAQVGQTYFQCVYLEAELTANLVHAREKAIDAFDARDVRRYMPHMSLVYSDDERDERLRLKSKADEVFKNASETLDEAHAEAFTPTSVSLWKTDVEDKSCKSWRKVKEFPLS